MSKEIGDRLSMVQHRLDRITPAIQQMGRVVSIIQYRIVSKTPELERRLVIFHGKKVVEEREAFEAKKREAKAKKAWTGDEIYRPRTFDTTLNDVASHLNKAVPAFNVELRQNLVYEVAVLRRQLSGDFPMEPEPEIESGKTKSLKAKESLERIAQGIDFRNLRMYAGISIKAFSYESGISVPAIIRVEQGKAGMSEGFLIGLLKVKSFTIPPSFFPDWLISPKNKGEYLKMKRITAGLNNAEFSRRTGKSHSSIAVTELGKTNPSAETVSLYEEVLEEKIEFPDFVTQQPAWT